LNPIRKCFDCCDETSATAARRRQSDRTGHAVLRVPLGSKGQSNQGASLSEVKVSGNYTAVAVQTAKIDDLGSADIGFIKIDVEGFESAVLRGARQTIARDRPTIFVEIEEQHTKRPIEQSLREVLALGYRGLFLFGGVLRSLSVFDAARHHRASDGEYVFNFVFLPEA